MRTLQAIILAAGEGTRMKSELPKVLHPICGRPMIAYAMDLAASCGVQHPVIVLGHGAEAVKPMLPKEAKVVIQTQRLGTGDAVNAARKALSGSGGPVLVLYADTPLLRRTTVQKLIEAHFKAGATCTFLTAHLADPSGYGRVLRNENSQISGIVEEAEANAVQRAIREINVGPLVCNAAAILEAVATVKPSRAKHELYLTDIISYLGKQDNAKIQVTRVEEVSEALGINSRTELARAIGVIRQRIVEAHLHNGVTIEDPQTTFIDQGVSIGVDTTVHPCTVIETGVTIGKRCSIGPFARLRSGVAIADEVKVGNFVELVRAKVGPRVRIGHVTYLGDAVVEEGANIGAGTITANYDGKEKHQTHIGKGAFIGSDTVLIAPVKIGAGAVTGAGSVVLKDQDVPAKGVVAGVPARPLTNHVGVDTRPMDHRSPVKAEQPAKRTTVLPRPRSDGQMKPAAKHPVKPARPRQAAGRAARGRAPSRRVRTIRGRRPAGLRRGARRPTGTRRVAVSRTRQAGLSTRRRVRPSRARQAGRRQLARR